MSEPVLRRSSRQATKKGVPVSPPTHITKKRAAGESKKPAVKKVKMTVDRTANATVSSRIEPASSSKSVGASGGPETAKPSAKRVPSPTSAKSNSKPSRAKKGETVPVGLKDGDFLPHDLPEVQTENGSKTTIDDLLETTQKGIIIFAFPKVPVLSTPRIDLSFVHQASTPGCTTQACLFRDNFNAFSQAGYTVYGLSGDVPASNEKFKTKQNLNYTLLCDPTYELHEKFAIKKKPKGTIRGVIIIEKTTDDGYAGKILRSAPASPHVSLQIAKEAVGIDEASNIAAAAEAKEAASKSASNETTFAVSATSVDTTSGIKKCVEKAGYDD